MQLLQMELRMGVRHLYRMHISHAFHLAVIVRRLWSTILNWTANFYPIQTIIRW